MHRMMAVCALICSISTVAVPKHHVDFDHAWNFTHYQTYRWAEPPDAPFFNQLMQERLTGFVLPQPQSQPPPNPLVYVMNCSCSRTRIWQLTRSSPPVSTRLRCLAARASSTKPVSRSCIS